MVSKAVLMLVAVPVLAGAVMLLWNAVVPNAFTGAHPLDYLHALGLLVLSRILFGGFRGRPGWHRRQQWERWQAMTPEERDACRGRRGSWRHAHGRE
jgi:hypothetical protein